MTGGLETWGRFMALLYEHTDCTTAACLAARIAPVLNLIFLGVLIWKIRR